MKRTPYLAAACYALLAAAFVLDLVTPQLFVAAILLNAPIALAGLALSTRLTTSMVVLAEIANVIAGYVNGVQAGYHWDSVAVGDRLLLGASFLLVGFLTIRAQENARAAGSASERAQLAMDEAALRRALEAVRATLNVDLVLRAIVREAQLLTGCDDALLIVRTTLEMPELYEFKRGAVDSTFQRRALDTATSSIVQRTIEMRTPSFSSVDEPVAGMILSQRNAERMAAVRIMSRDTPAALLLFSSSFRPGLERLLQLFADGASVALTQAWLFTQLGFRNEEIASQRNALEERSRVIRDIVYALAHDLRTPLTAEHVTMEQALRGAYGDLPASYREVLETTLQTNADLRHLVETLLVVARFESGESSTLREEFDLGEQAQRVVRELESIARLKPVSVQAAVDEGVRISGDPSEVRRAISNLLSNAITATPAGGTVWLRVTATNGEASLTVEDDGYGVAPQQRDVLFQRFGTSARTLGSGSGLGLYIVRLIAEKLGGSATYRPREPRGSIFLMTIPLSRSRQPA